MPHGSNVPLDTTTGADTARYDYRQPYMPWWQQSPGTQEDLDLLTQQAGGLKPNTAASNTNFGWQRSRLFNNFGENTGGFNGALAQMYQGQNALQRGPQNAFDRSTMQNLQARALGNLQSGNRQAMAGLAGSNAGRGVAGLNAGGLLGQQLGVANAGAVAGAGFDAYLKGREQGVSEYGARVGAAGQLGQLFNEQENRNLQMQNQTYAAYNKEKDNAFTDYQTKQQDLANFLRQHMQELGATSGQGSGIGDQQKDYARFHFQQLVREMNIAKQNYLRYGNQNNPTSFAPIYSGSDLVYNR